MPITSIHFFLLVCVVFLLYYQISPLMRWVLLLVVSAYFYIVSNPTNLLLFAILICVNYFASRYISTPSSRFARQVFWVGIFVNLSALIFYKYINFILQSVSKAFPLFDISYLPKFYNFVAPIGISFFVFQALAYLIDIKNGTQKSEKHFGKLATFLSFFPIITSGPIERGKNLLPQINANSDFDFEVARLGLKRIVWGTFKKLVIADRLAIYVNPVFDNPSEFFGLAILIAILFFAFQLYCDFSGYSDIVIGIAKLLGYNLTENFKSPYFSTSIQSFWNSWHISLSMWLRDYIFFPLRRNMLRKKTLPSWFTQMLPPLITMLVSGIWHGAGWNFVIWGGLHGIYLITEGFAKPIFDKYVGMINSAIISKFYISLQILLTFSLVCFGWVFFRSSSISDAFLLFRNIQNIDIQFYTNALQIKDLTLFLKPFIFDGGLSQTDFIFSIFLIIFLTVAEVFHNKYNLFDAMDKLPTPLRWTFYLVALFSILLLSADSSTQNFIYFKF